MPKRILVVGGAGYIGSHMSLMLEQYGYETVVLDSLETGYRDAVVAGKLIEGSIENHAFLMHVFRQFQFDAVMHFASYIQVGESVKAPEKYYRNNVANTLVLLEVMRAFQIDKFVFSSTAAIFGEPQYVPIDAQHPKNPINPYGRSKWMVEQMLADFDKAYGLKSICLRYFNAAGADPKGRVGERHEPETHLIPLILQVASNRREAIKVFGRDYPTPDGTCIRDYVHVEDLCSAHLLALEHLLNEGESAQFNLGNGQGFSVAQVIETAQHVTGKAIKVIDAPRREGDPAVLVADAEQAKTSLNWQPKYSDLATIIEHAWQWERQMSNRCE